MQSRAHEIWAYFFCGTRGETADYTPTDCFEPFAFPRDCEASEGLAAAGESYYEFRAKLMVERSEGLTKTYNRFHDPDERSPDIIKLRDLHATMDRAVIEAYGWKDLAAPARCEFILDYEDEEDDEGTSARKSRSKPWRFRWPDEFQDAVLARMLALNQQRAEEQRLAATADPEVTNGHERPRAARRKDTEQGETADGLFGNNDKAFKL